MLKFEILAPSSPQLGGFSPDTVLGRIVQRRS
jgi:hypothetical protein